MLGRRERVLELIEGAKLVNLLRRSTDRYGSGSLGHVGEHEPLVRPESERGSDGQSDDVGGDVVRKGGLQTEQVVRNGQAEQRQPEAYGAHAHEECELAPRVRAPGVAECPVSIADPRCDGCDRGAQYLRQ